MDLQIDPSWVIERPTPSGEFSRVWEHRTFNRHCGVIEWHVAGRCSSPDGIEEFVRSRIGPEFSPVRFRGFVFGAVLHITGTTIGPGDIGVFDPMIDRRDKSKGVWQWMVICFEREKTAIGIHTWMKHLYLHPVYESVLQQFTAAGYDCQSFYVETPRFFALVEKLNRFRPASLALMGIGLLVGLIGRFVRWRRGKRQAGRPDAENQEHL